VLRRIDENRGVMSGRIQVEVANQLLGSGVNILMNECQQSKTDKHYK